MSRLAVFAALLGGALATPALSADLYTKAPSAPATPAYLDEWSGVYVGFQSGYGWGRQPFDVGSTLAGVDISKIAGSGGGASIPAYSAVDIGKSINRGGNLLGGFAGAQKQFGNWVVGVEADVNATSMGWSTLSVQNGVAEAGSHHTK